MFLTDDDLTGFAIENGDIIGVFNANGQKHGAMPYIMKRAIAEGGRKLDCYGKTLLKTYNKNGHMVLAAVIKYNGAYVDNTPENAFLTENQPDVYVMYHDPNAPLYDTDQAVNVAIEKARVFEGDDAYDDALAYRDSLLEQTSTN